MTMQRRVMPTIDYSERRQESPLLEWSQQFLPVHFSAPPSEMHHWLSEQCDLMQRNRGSFVNLVGPRGHAKSMIATTAYPLRCAVEGWEPFIWIASETSKQAGQHLGNIVKELIENQHLASAYPESVGEGPVWQAEKIKLRNGVVIQSVSIGQTVRGIRHGAHRPSLIVCDDLQDDKIATSALRREKDWSWFNGLLLKAGTTRTNFINVANALHRESIGLKLAESPGWVSRVFSAIIDWPTNMQLWSDWAAIYDDPSLPPIAADEFFEAHRQIMLAGSRVLWPEWEGLLALMQMREREGHTAFEREKQSRPISPEQCEWPESYFEDHIWFDEWPREWDCKSMALDPSKGKDAKRGDYSAFVWGQLLNGVLYVDADLKRRDPARIVQDGVELYRAFAPDGFGCESNSFQDLLVGEFTDEFRKHGMTVSPYAIENRVAKVARIRKLTPWLAQHRIRFRKKSAGAQLLVQQLKDFPDPHSHDDGPDACEMMIRLMEELLGTGAAKTAGNFGGGDNGPIFEQISI